MARRIELCGGKDCRKHKKSFRALYESLHSMDGFVLGKCQGVCSGPVICLRRKKKKYIFRKIREKKLVSELCFLLQTNSAPQKKNLSKALNKLLKVKK